MRDSDIRKIVISDLKKQNDNDPKTIIIEELGLCEGDARIDIAVINGSIHGYEIKSDSDTLKRLPSQIEIYSRTLEYVTIIIGGRHLKSAIELIPKWWGIIDSIQTNNGILLRPRRKFRPNPNLDPFAVVKLLWRNEAMVALKQRDLQHGLSKKPRSELWERLAENLSISELLSLVSDTLKSRSSWRFAR